MTSESKELFYGIIKSSKRSSAKICHVLKYFTEYIVFTYIIFHYSTLFLVLTTN